jgi:diaminopimelate epimerase
MQIWKAHAYGNDFLYVRSDEALAAELDAPALARMLCERHTGIGGDGLILYTPTPMGARMRLVNADGSHAEVSGNGVRALGALIAHERGLSSGRLVIDTDAGAKSLDLLRADSNRRFLFRADMGPATRIATRELTAAGESLQLVSLWMGNPQAVVLGELDEARLARLGPALQRHSEFPDGVNVELAKIESPDRVSILIWERGVGPTRSSGTGSCAAAVAAAVAGGANRSVDVVAPGGAQRVEWTGDTVRLTGWAEVLFQAAWGGR